MAMKTTEKSNVIDASYSELEEDEIVVDVPKLRRNNLRGNRRSPRLLEILISMLAYKVV